MLMSSNDQYDVIVVGAGPAGSMTAKVAAENGLSVLLIEEHKKIGEPLQCGEFMPSSSQMKLLLPNAPNHDKTFFYPDSIIKTKIEKIRIYGPKESFWEFDFDGYVIDRPLFDEYLAKKALEAGAEIITGKRVVDVSLHSVTLSDTTKLNAKVIVGADGPASIVARKLNYPHYQKNPNLFASAVEYQLDNVTVEPNVVEMYFGSKVAPGGYAWIIPKSSNVANVGLGLRATFKKQGHTLFDYLNFFIRNNSFSSSKVKNGNIIRKIAGSVPVGGPLKRTWSTSSLLVGDAAGFVMATNGGGVPTALVGGIAAGEAIESHINDTLSLEYYETLWKKYMGNELENALKLREMMDIAMKRDTLFEKALRLLGTNAMCEIIMCKIPKRLRLIAKILRK